MCVCRLMKGEDPYLVPMTPKPACEDLVPTFSSKQIEDYLERKEGIEVKQDVLPSLEDEDELNKMDQDGLNLARTLFKFGKKENYEDVLNKCKQHKEKMMMSSLA